MAKKHEFFLKILVKIMYNCAVFLQISLLKFLLLYFFPRKTNHFRKPALYYRCNFIKYYNKKGTVTNSSQCQVPLALKALHWGTWLHLCLHWGSCLGSPLLTSL